MFYGWLFIVPLWGMAAHPDPGFSTARTYAWLIGTAALFLLGWGISRGTNMQKYTFKRWPDRKFLGFIEPEYIQAVTARSSSAVSGVSPATSTTWASGPSPWQLAWSSPLRQSLAWTYTIFVFGFFTWRQLADDKHCAEKYGAEKWAEYQARVKYRIFPGVY